MFTFKTHITLRLIFTLVVGIIASGILMGQNHAKSKVIPHHTTSKITLYTLGEYKLNRHKATKLKYKFKHQGDSDTFVILVRNQEGLPFKKVGWKINKNHHNILKEKAEFEDNVPTNFGKNLKLYFKPIHSLNRQNAYVQVLVRDTTKSDQAPAVDSVLKLPVPSLPNGKKDALRFICDYLALYLQLLDPSSGVITEELIAKAGDIPQIMIDSFRTLEPEKPSKQKKSYSPSGLQIITQTASPPAFHYRDFKKGDTVLFYVEAEKPLKSIWLTRGKDTIINQVKNAVIIADTQVIEDESLLALHLDGYFSKEKNTVAISVTRIRPAKPDSISYRVNYSLFKKATAKYDTILYTVIDQNLTLSPIREIEREPFAQVEVQIPKRLGEGYSLTKAAYWLGIGRDCLNNFLSLEATVPPTWSKPGASPAMGALVLGRSLVLPPIGNVEVISRFSSRSIGVNKQGQKINLKENLPHGQNAGLLTLAEIKNWYFEGKSLVTNSPSYNFYACFQNKSTAIPYPIQLKVVGSYRKTTPVPAQLVSKGTKSIKLPLAQ